MPVWSAPHIKCIEGREVRTVVGSDASYDRFNPHPPPITDGKWRRCYRIPVAIFVVFELPPHPNPRPPGCSGCTPGRTLFPLLIASELHTHVDLLITASWYRLRHLSQEVQGPSCLLMHESGTTVGTITTRKAISRLPDRMFCFMESEPRIKQPDVTISLIRRFQYRYFLKIHFNIIFPSGFEAKILCIFLVHSTHDTRRTFLELPSLIFLNVCTDTVRCKIIQNCH